MGCMYAPANANDGVDGQASLQAQAVPVSRSHAIIPAQAQQQLTSATTMPMVSSILKAGACV